MRTRFFKVGKGKYIYKGWWILSSVICDVFGRIELYGYENVPKEPCIIVANHVSYLDPMAAAFFHETELCAVARDTLMDGKFSGAFFRSLNAIPIKRGQSGNLGAFREVLARIKSGVGVIIFPEGTRSFDGKLQRGKAGAGLLAIKSGAPILPLKFVNMYDILPRTGRLRGGTRLILCAGKPINPKEIDLGKDAPDRAQIIVDRIMERIAEIEPPVLREI